MRITRTVRALGVTALAVSLAGCMKVDMDLDLQSDETVDGSMIIAFDREFAELMGETDAMTDGLLDESADLPAGSTSEPYEDDDYIGARYTFEDTSLSEFVDDGDGSLSITHEGDEFVVGGEVDLSSTATDLGDLDAGDLGDAEMFEGMMDAFDVRISITFPGDVLEHNGDLDGRTVTWAPDPGETLELSARARDSGGASGIPAWAWILIAVLAVAGVLAALFFASRREPTEAATESPTDAVAEAPTETPPPPPPV